MCSVSRMDLMISYCARITGESGVAPLPSRAARTSRASSLLPFRTRRRGESGRKGQTKQMIAEKKI